MATNTNVNAKILVNLFHKGMNTDTAINMLDNEHYIYGKNIRISQQTPLGMAIDVNRTKGCVTPVPKGYSKKTTLSSVTTPLVSILATASVDNYGAVIVKDKTGIWYVYRIEHNDEDLLKYELVFTSNNITKKERFSVVMSQELENVIKLYVATDDGIAQFNILDTEYTTGLKSVDEAISNRLWPYQKPILEKKTGGSLPVGQVQWVYRLYKNHGAFSKLSATTNKIQIFSSNRVEVLGNEQASIDDEGKLSTTNSGIGFRLRIPIKEEGVFDFTNVYDHVQLFRIQYYSRDVIKVFLIQQAQFKSDQTDISILDDGIEPLQEYTLDEFSALEGLDIVADSIETASSYMFAGNIEDRSSLNIEKADWADEEDFPQILASHTVSVDEDDKCHLYGDDKITIERYYAYLNTSDVNSHFYNAGHEVNDDFDTAITLCPGETNYYGGKTLNGFKADITWKFVEAFIPLHDDPSHENPVPNVSKKYTDLFNIRYITNDGETHTTQSIAEYLNAQDIECLPEIYQYGDNITSSMFRSLRRGETYRYGIIYYNKFGQRTDVQWIDDIKVPSNFVTQATSVENHNGHKVLYAKPIGIQFDVNIDEELREKLNIERYQIVRCAHTKEFSKQLYQVVQNAPIRTSIGKDNAYMSPWTPVATIQDFQFYTTIAYKKQQWTATCQFADEGSSTTGTLNTTDYYIKNLYGPDINYSRETVLSRLQQAAVKYRPIRRLYSEYGCGFDQFDQEKTYAIGDIVRYDGSLYKFKNAHNPGAWNAGDVDRIGSAPKKHPWLDLYYNARRKKDLGITDRHSKITQDQVAESYFCGLKINNPKIPMLGGAVGMTSNDKEKNSRYVALNYYNSDGLTYNDYGEYTYDIEQFTGTKSPNWEDNFVDVTTDDFEEVDDLWIRGYPADAAEQYKGFTSSVKGQSYDNWVCYDMYDMRPGMNGDPDGVDDIFEPGASEEAPTYLIKTPGGAWYGARSRGHCWSGPGPVTILAAFAKKDGEPYWGPWGLDGADSNESESEDTELGGIRHDVYNHPFITTLISLEHNGSTYQGATKSELQYDTYYGFGYYGKLGEPLIVFDGDTYITPAEIQSAYKTWNSLSNYTYGIRSISVINYIPIESEINSTLDYGQNFKNTFNQNVQLEPSDIEGVTIQDRPQFQYNQVMSYNNYSAMSFTAQTEDDIDEKYPQRIFYSELKQNGEVVDNWGLFKALNYVDANTRYGKITNLLTSKETLYFWQPSAFGKLSVNERSLITDENSNKIQLGTGGVLQRTDYIDTDTGMSEDQYAAISVGDTVYWIDTLRRSIMKFQGGNVISIGVESATQNLLNWKFDEKKAPYISYDVQNDEVLSQCLSDEDSDSQSQFVYLNNLRMTSSEYTRQYDSTVTLHGILYGLKLLDDESIQPYGNVQSSQYNYLGTENDKMLSPMELKFVVAQDPSITKVYDDQKIVIVDDLYNDTQYVFSEQFAQMKLTYFTDIHDPVEYTGDNVPSMSFREGEFKYALPRWEGDYGERIRGKWLVQDMVTLEPESDIAIAQILTKVRTSFS